MVKKIVKIVLVVLLIAAIVVMCVPAARKTVGGWFSNIFSSSDEKPDGAGDTTTDSGTDSTPDNVPAEDEGETLIADLPAAERIPAIQKKLAEIAARDDKDDEYTLEEALLLTMQFALDKDGKVLESGHNMAAPGVQTYSMDSYPGGWEWAKTADVVKVPMFVSGHMISVDQTSVTKVMEYVSADGKPVEITLCKDDDNLLSGYFVRTEGDLAIVTFNTESFSELKNAFKWWYETDGSGNKVVKIGFDYCNDAPEGTKAVPIFLPIILK